MSLKAHGYNTVRKKEKKIRDHTLLMQQMLAIAGFHADDSSPSPKLDMFPYTSQPDFASWIQEAATLHTCQKCFNGQSKKLET